MDAAYPSGFWEDAEKLRGGDAAGLESAVCFLAADPIFFRTGYVKAWLIRAIKPPMLKSDDKKRLQDAILSRVDRRDDRDFRAFCRLAKKVDDANLREQLTQRADEGDFDVRRRARWVMEALAQKDRMEQAGKRRIRDRMPNEYINPNDLFSSVPFGFSQVVVTTGTKTIYVSGQTARDAQQNSVSGLAGQTVQALRNVETALASAGAALSDVAALRIYIVNYQIEQASVISGTLKQFFPADRLPASTWIGVAALASPEFLIEIEATAVMESQHEAADQP